MPRPGDSGSAGPILLMMTIRQRVRVCLAWLHSYRRVTAADERMGPWPGPPDVGRNDRAYAVRARPACRTAAARNNLTRHAGPADNKEAADGRVKSARRVAPVDQRTPVKGCSLIHVSLRPSKLQDGTLAAAAFIAGPTSPTPAVNLPSSNTGTGQSIRLDHRRFRSVNNWEIYRFRGRMVSPTAEPPNKPRDRLSPHGPSYGPTGCMSHPADQPLPHIPRPGHSAQATTTPANNVPTAGANRQLRLAAH